MTDRRSHDPFAPPPPDASVESSGSEPEFGEREQFSGDVYEPSDGNAEGDSLDDMRRADLLKLAESEGLAAYGTKDDLIRRIRKHRAG